MNKIRSFLLCLIIFWLFGFIYVFLTSGADRETAQKLQYKEANGKAESAAEYYDPKNLDDKVRLDFKKIVNDLRVLEAKNAKNDEIIKSLRLLYLKTLNIL